MVVESHTERVAAVLVMVQVCMAEYTVVVYALANCVEVTHSVVRSVMQWRTMEMPAPHILAPGLGCALVYC